MRDPFGHGTLMCGVFYKDPEAALDWLEQAFDLKRCMVVRDSKGDLVHAEMQFNDAHLIIDSEWADDIASPVRLGLVNTQRIYLRLVNGIDSHCEAARRAGAEIVQEPEDQFYGDRTYRARDPEGHVWTFSQTVRVVSRADAEDLTGFKIEGWHAR